MGVPQQAAVDGTQSLEDVVIDQSSGLFQDR